MKEVRFEFYAKRSVASAITTLSAILDPVMKSNPSPRNTSNCDIKVSTVYITKVSLSASPTKEGGRCVDYLVWTQRREIRS